jgi:L-Ala-D/L-Glu epimerase
MPLWDTSIDSIHVHRFNIPLSQPFVIALETITNAENIVVEIRTSSGLSGFGECSPYRSIAGETQDTCMAAAKVLAAALQNRSALRLEDNLRALDQAIWGNHCIKSAFDMALYDVAAQAAGLPLYAFLGGANNKPLATDMTIGIGSPETMASEAIRFKDAGFHAIKVKLGTDTASDIERIKAIRAAIGHEIPLRIDANQGWDTLTAIRTLQALHPYSIDYCEQPVSRQNEIGMAEVRYKSPIPIMADESVGDHHDALRLIRAGACDMFNIKLAKSGGIRNALQISAVAEAAGMPCQIGCFSESRLAMTAFAHVALARHNIQYYDLDCALMLADDPVNGGASYSHNGHIIVSDAPGLGISGIRL